ncbi:hypothetical protein FIBSPDRAFT_877800 [Athelia psychrophila]|uniref:Uncharacterized protein n=1 Tax=Athelia psychrophila TaxID=1759441 RepID=A0A167VMZ7_9AGAM|nr:hypothetical protein FIBSPDRAFT_877800 [Fibularhizoctonia sp. CBS 109695]
MSPLLVAQQTHRCYVRSGPFFPHARFKVESTQLGPGLNKCGGSGQVLNGREACVVTPFGGWGRRGMSLAFVNMV